MTANINWKSLSLLGAGIFSALATACNIVASNRTPFHFRIIHDDPNDLLREATKNAAERWRNAIGFDVQVIPKGVNEGDYTIEWVSKERMKKEPGAITSTGQLVGGLSFPKYILIRNDISDFDQLEAVVTHEMAHVFTKNGQHAKSGVFMSKAVAGAPINQDVLDTVCEQVDCEFTMPEPDGDSQT